MKELTATPKSLLRFFTAGAVDDGKSTLIGRLLIDSHAVFKDHLKSLKDISHLTDGLKTEREQGITIDVAYRYFSTKARDFILADAPGHEEYMHNMATAASHSDVAILLIDAVHGVTDQTRRHTFVASLFGVSKFLVVVNKMDLVEYSKNVFEKIQSEFLECAVKLNIQDLQFVPVVALHGDNVVQSSKKMPWFKGPTVSDYLERVFVNGESNAVDFRFPVQLVLKSKSESRLYAGEIASGSLTVGETVQVLPSLQVSQVKAIETYDGPIDRAVRRQAVAIALKDDLDIGRGDMIVRLNNQPHVQHEFEAMFVWMSSAPMRLGEKMLIRHTTRWEKAEIEELYYEVDVHTYRRKKNTNLRKNSIARARLRSSKPLFLDEFQKNKSTGSFILVDPTTHETLAAGVVIERMPFAKQKESLPLCYWLTGLSGSGKSTIAHALKERLELEGEKVVIVDGDALRSGLSKDLGFSKEARAENIRRAAEMVKILHQNGLTVICALISPFEADRNSARSIIGELNFLEIFIDTPREICEARDPKGLYRKARSGELPGFTGISSPYEKPSSPWLTVKTTEMSTPEVAQLIVTKSHSKITKM
jgi:bifunctional enzyme CysN/CysC